MKKYLRILQEFLLTHLTWDKKWRRVVSAMAMVVVFITTYALILPAITLEKEKGKPEQGVYLDQMERGSTASLQQNSSKQPATDSVQDTEGKTYLSTDDEGEELNSSDSIGEDKESVPTETEEEQTDQKSFTLDSTDQNHNEPDQDGQDHSSQDEKTSYANGIYIGKGDGYTLSLDLKEEMKLPADVSISVEEIKEEDNTDIDTAAVYSSYMTAARRAAAREGRGEFTSVRFLKFALFSNGEEIRPSQDIDILVVPTQKDKVRNGDEAHVLTFQGSVAHMIEDMNTQMSGYRVSAYRFIYPSTVNNRNWGLLCFAVTEPKAEEEEKAEEMSAETTDSTETEPSIEEEQVSTEEMAASTEETAASTEEIAASTEEMAASTEKIAASTEETSASTEEIAATEESTETEPTNTEAEENWKSVEKLEYQGQDYKVVMTCDDKAGIPEGAALQVTEIRKDSDDYEKYLQEASETLEMNKMANPTARFFDIKIMDGEKEIEPAAPVSVEITYDKPMEVKEGEKVDALHFGEKKTEIIDDVEVQTNKNDDVKSVTFDADSFSVYGVLTYTVDFTFDGYSYSMEGNSTIKLSKLVEILEIAGKDKDYETGMAFVKDVEEVTFTDESLVRVEKAGLFGTGVFSWGDWELISQKPFDTEETLTIAMKDGIKYEIQVTDARKPVLTNTYGRVKIVKEWYDAEGHRIEAPELDDTYTSDFILTAYEYTPSDIVRLHFIDSQGNEDSSKTVIVPTGKLQLTLYNTPANAGKGYLFADTPSAANPITNPYNNINLLTDVSIQSKTAELDDGNTINYWVMDIDLNDYANELTDVYLGIMPSGETSGISYFTDGTYPDRMANVSAGSSAMNIAYTDSGRWEGDTYRNRHIWDMIKGTNNEYTLQNQDLELTSAGGSGTSTVGSFFGYTIVENKASAGGANNFTTTISWNNGVDTIYSNGLTGWAPNLYLTSPNPEMTVVVKNQLRADVDVPVEKHWSYMDENDDAYDWEAKFVLQWAPLYEGEGTPSTEFVEVEPRQYITITEAMMDDFGNTFPARSFKGLPMYGEDENGPFRYEYSVEEESYTIKSHSTGEVVATYDRYGAEGEKYTGSLPHFTPFYPHDAGELSANPNDYSISVVNAQAYSEDSPTINITVNKLWEDEEVMEDDTHDYKAYVKIQRYDQQSTRKLQDYDPDTMVEIKFFDQNNNYVKSEYVEKGVQQRLHITWNSYGYGNSKFALTSSPNVVNFSNMNHQCGYGETLDEYTNWFYPTDDMEIHVTTNVWNNSNDPAVNLKASGLELLDEQTSAPGAPDNAYNNDPENEFTLSLLQNRWSTIITGLPLVEYTQEGDTQTVHHYSYYFVEEEEKTTPTGYKSSYVRYDTVGTDHEIELGDDKYRINYDGEHVTIKNTKDTLRIHKEWRGVAKSDWPLYPNTVFDLYGANRNTPLNNATDGTLIRSGLQLNKTNNWEWMPEDEDWGAGGFPQYDYYYVVERTDLMAANAELGTPAWDNRYEIWMYYNENGTGSNAHPWEAKTSGTGSITILNALHDSEYLQLDLKKKWMEWGTPTSWDTTTGVYKRLHGLVMGFVVYRRVWDVPVQTNSQYPSDHIISPGPMGWSDYGNEILVGYDSNGQRVLDDGGNTFELINGDGGNWHWTIKNQADHGKTTSDQIGLTSEGWYTKEDGSVVWAYYEYTVRETGIWKNLKKDPVDDPEISWFSNSVPMAAWYKSSSQHRVDEFNRDIGQDQDRLMNGQAFDMWLEKDWVDGAWDAREVYVKVYRKLQQGGNLEDFTEELARDISIGNLIGYLDEGYQNMIDVDNKWIVFTPGKSKIYIDKVLKTHPNASGTNPYDYWIVEVGYKDKHGNVFMYNGNGTDQQSVNDNTLLKLGPTYYAWDGSKWINQPNLTGQNNPNVGIVLGDKGTNQLKITNTPVRDFAVIKKWQNALGEDLQDHDIPVDQLQVKIKQTRKATIGNDVVSKEAYVRFNGSDTLNLTKDNRANNAILVAQTHPGNSNDSQTYNATITDNTNIGKWALYLSGLEECYYDEDGNLWTCTYQVEEILTQQITEHFVTEVTADGLIDRDNRNITISNIKMDGGMLKVVKQIAEGSDYNTEDPFKITVTLTPPLKPGPEGEQGKREDVFDLGPAEHPNHTIGDYIEIDEDDTILIGTPETSIADNKTVTITMTLAGRGSFTIKDIRVGTTYEVSEDLSGTHGWRQDGEVAYSNSDKTIVKRQMDTAMITNKEAQDEDGALKISKIVKVNGGNAGASQYDLVDGEYTFTITGPTAAEAGMQVTKFVKITVEQGQMASYKISDTDTEAAWEAATAVTGTWAVVDGLEEGDYVITEAAVEGMTVGSITGGNNDGDTDDRTITVHVTAGDTAAVKSDAQATYTNNRSMIDIKIIKIDETTRSSASQTKLPGATFKLYRYSVPSGSDTGTYVVYPDEAGSTATTSNESGGNYGTLSFRNLPDGYYKISETAVPEGYIKSENNDIYFDIVGGVITRYTGAYTGTARSSADEIPETSNVAMVTYMKADKTFTVGNTPGAALPSPGGPGTLTGILFGGALSILAVFLLRNRRLKPLWKH